MINQPIDIDIGIVAMADIDMVIKQCQYTKATGPNGLPLGLYIVLH